MRMHVPVVHQAQPHFDDLPFDELMFTDLNYIRDPSIVRALALEDLVVMMIVNLACCCSDQPS